MTAISASAATCRRQASSAGLGKRVPNVDAADDVDHVLGDIGRVIANPFDGLGDPDDVERFS
jgi:hypothetical protein